jgi:hypothetical protein
MIKWFFRKFFYADLKITQVGLWNEYSFADNSRVKIILKKAMIYYRKYCTV